MKFTRSLPALLCSAMLVGMVYAADSTTTPPAEPKAPTTKPDKKPEKLKVIRLTKPYSLLEDLSQDQKEQINKIHTAALEEKKKIDDKEEADCNAVLTDVQKAELIKAEEKEKAEAKEKMKKAKEKATTKAAE